MLKSNALVAFVKKANLEDWGYVGGGQGELYTPELAEKWARTRGHPDGYYLKDCARWFGHYVADCSGLIIAGFRMLMSSKYQDQTADTLYARCKVKGTMKTLPEIPGVCLHKKGHIGIYIGGGYAIESRGRKYGVVKTKVSSRPWTGWGKLKDVDYSEDAAIPVPLPKIKYTGKPYANVRSGPSILYRKLSQIHTGDIALKLGDTKGKWMKVRFEGNDGWTYNDGLFVSVK